MNEEDKKILEEIRANKNNPQLPEYAIYYYLSQAHPALVEQIETLAVAAKKSANVMVSELEKAKTDPAAAANWERMMGEVLAGRVPTVNQKDES